MKLNRRDFIKGFGAFVAGLGLGATKAEAKEVEAVPAIPDAEVELSSGYVVPVFDLNKQSRHAEPAGYAAAFAETVGSNFMEGWNAGFNSTVAPADAYSQNGELTFENIERTREEFAARASEPAPDPWAWNWVEDDGPAPADEIAQEIVDELDETTQIWYSKDCGTTWHCVEDTGQLDVDEYTWADYFKTLPSKRKPMPTEGFVDANGDLRWYSGFGLDET